MIYLLMKAYKMGYCQIVGIYETKEEAESNLANCVNGPDCVYSVEEIHEYTNYLLVHAEYHVKEQRPEIVAISRLNNYAEAVKMGYDLYDKRLNMVNPNEYEGGVMLDDTYSVMTRRKIYTWSVLKVGLCDMGY